KALLTPGRDGRLPMETLIATTQGCLQALTDDVSVVNHGGSSEAGQYRALVRPFTVRLSPGPLQKTTPHPPHAAASKPSAAAAAATSLERPPAAAAGASGGVSQGGGGLVQS
ncbi:unnamed protein product, partial [Ectocarpus sp. 4 AP-2014]